MSSKYTDLCYFGGCVKTQEHDITTDTEPGVMTVQVKEQNPGRGKEGSSSPRVFRESMALLTL